MSKTKTHEEYIEEFKESKNKKVIILGKYINARTKILVKCTNKNCKHEWLADPRGILRGYGCNKCQNRANPPIKKKKTDAKFKEEVHLLHPDITIIGLYTGSHENVLVRCNLDGHEWNPLVTNLLHKNLYGCPKCAIREASKRLSLSHEVFIQRFNNCDNNKYVNITGTYTGIDDYIDCQCVLCKNQFKSTPYRVLNGVGCPLCNMPKGEKRIFNFLDFNDITYETQVKYDGLVGVGGGLLSYDFYLSTYNLLIEYQGEFHDGSCREYTQINLETQREHDKRKREYAFNNNIKLLEIWHWDFNNIEEILKENLFEGKSNEKRQS